MRILPDCGHQISVRFIVAAEVPRDVDDEKRDPFTEPHAASVAGCAEREQLGFLDIFGARDGVYLVAIRCGRRCVDRAHLMSFASLGRSFVTPNWNMAPTMSMIAIIAKERAVLKDCA